jgi:CubicO group peptidase (beta-lactamase class C family)
MSSQESPVKNSICKIRNRKFRVHSVPPSGSGFLAAILALALCYSAIRANAQAEPAKAGTEPTKSAAKNSSGAAELPEVKPESVGFSSERLTRLESAMQTAIDQKQLAGGVTMLVRHGKIAEFKAYGLRDLATGKPTEKDTIFRIFSMTKPVTSTAMMILYEQGKWNPQDPISKYIPEFAQLKVFKGVDSSGNMVTEDPVHAPTMRELMTHTAGFSYGGGTTPADKMYGEKRVLGSASLQEMIEKLAAIPLLYQPGTRWVYSVSVDIQGYIVEKLSGKSLPDFMRENIFQPLGMRDTGFYVPAEKSERFAALYRWDQEKSALVLGSGSALGIDYSKQPGMASGGGGLVSTARDYSRFAQMLSNGGQLGTTAAGVRILGPETVKLMSANHLPPQLMGTDVGMKFWGNLRYGFGYGYDFGVFVDPGLADSPVGKGTFMWDGAAGTWFWIDPLNDIVFVGMVQRLGGGPFVGGMQEIARATVYQALLEK